MTRDRNFSIFRRLRSAQCCSLPVALWPVLLLSGLNSFAAITFVWDGGGGRDNWWETGLNWVGDSAPGPTAAAQFDNTGASSPTVDVKGNQTIGSLTFLETTAYTFVSQNRKALTIGTEGISNFSSATQIFMMELDLVLGASQTWNASAGNLTIQSAVDTGSNVLTLAAESGKAGTISGAITGVGGSVAKIGSGSWTLFGSNNYTGGTMVNGGTLRFSGTNLDVGAVTVASGAVLEIGLSNTLPATTALTLNGGTLALAGNFNQTFTTALNLTANSASTIDFGAPGTANTISFGGSSGNWTTGTTLTIANYTAGSDQLRFGASATGLSALQLAGITFTGFAPGAEISAAGFVTPVPEPSTYAATAGVIVLAVGGYLRRRTRGRTSPAASA
jgi:autotransporter-associated beta strand protein